MTVRTTFLAAAYATRTAIADRDVARRWDEPSALERMSIGGLAGHLARGVFTVQEYLAEAPPAGGSTVSPAAYFVEGVKLTSNIDDELNAGIRARAHAEAAEGHTALLSRLDDAIERLTEALSREPASRTVAVRGGTPMLLDDYLVARVVELVVHLDDLAASIDSEPAIPRDGLDVAITCMVDMARLDHGDTAVLRVLARRERAPSDVFPVF
jgi:hypothetical protein